MWSLTFISEDDLHWHVIETIKKYGDKLKSYNISRFNNNIVDPIKLIFDKTVYHYTWEEIINANFNSKLQLKIANSRGISFVMAIYLLGFSSYNGFKDI